MRSLIGNLQLYGLTVSERGERPLEGGEVTSGQGFSHNAVWFLLQIMHRPLAFCHHARQFLAQCAMHASSSSYRVPIHLT